MRLLTRGAPAYLPYRADPPPLWLATAAENDKCRTAILTVTALAALDHLAMELLWAGRDRDADAIWAVMKADGLAALLPSDDRPD